MNEHMNEMKDIIKKNLFLPGLLALRTILVKPLSKYNGKKPNIPTLPGWIKTDDTDDTSLLSIAFNTLSINSSP